MTNEEREKEYRERSMEDINNFLNSFTKQMQNIVDTCKLDVLAGGGGPLQKVRRLMHTTQWGMANATMELINVLRQCEDLEKIGEKNEST